MAKWLAKEFDWDIGRYTGNYYDIAEAGIVAVFVDSFYGDDTAAGTAAAPFKTLGKAITTLNSTGADGSRIFMNGVFSETLPTQTYWYQFIGCGGGKNGRVVFYQNVILNKEETIWENVETINYGGLTFNTRFNSITTTRFVNCILQNAKLWGAINSGGTLNQLTFYYCVLKELFFDGNYNRQWGQYNLVLNCTSVAVYSKINHMLNSYILNTDYSNIVNPETMLLDVDAQFINYNDNNFNTYITSPLLGSGAPDNITGIPTNIGGVQFGLSYDGRRTEFIAANGATITDLTVDATGKYTITAPATSGTLESALMDLGNIYPLENIDLFNVFDFEAGEITQGVFEAFSSPRMALTIKLKYGLTSAEVDDCPWLLIEYGKQPTFSGTGASRVGNAEDAFDPDTFQTITCRYMKLFITLQNNS